MTSIRNYLKILDEKLLVNTDYSFLNSIKKFFPSSNPYFIVCLAEIIVKYQNKEDNNIHQEISFEDYLKVLIEEATILYQSSNISEYLNEVITIFPTLG